MKKYSQFVTIAALLCTSAVLGKADPIDPVFTMSDPDSGTPIFSSSFSFSSNGNGGGLLSFVNESQVDWKGLAVQVTQPTGSIITCSGGTLFSNCLISSIPESGGVSLFTLNFTLRTKEGGILNGEPFTINLNDFVGDTQPTDPNGNGGWGPNISFAAQVTDSTNSTSPTNPSPEPATFFLLGSALVSAFTGRRFLKKMSC